MERSLNGRLIASPRTASSLSGPQMLIHIADILSILVVYYDFEGDIGMADRTGG